jgi:hypothetical protein
MSATRFAAVVGVAWLQLAIASGAVAKAPLADAAENRDVDAVRVLLEKEADVNARQPDGMTALHWAAHHDDLSAVKLFIAAGADANAANRYGGGLGGLVLLKHFWRREPTSTRVSKRNRPH